MMNKKPEKELYKAFVSFYCCTSWPEVNMGNQCDILKPFIPNMHDTLCRPNKATTGYAFSIKPEPDCTMDDKENRSIDGTDVTVAEVFVQFKSSSRYDPFLPTPSADNMENIVLYPHWPLPERSLVRLGHMSLCSWIRDT